MSEVSLIDGHIDDKDTVKSTCPFCGSTVERLHEECNGFCRCGAKYYFVDREWMNRRTGETIKVI